MKEFHLDFNNLPFLETSKTAAHPNRLNWRCDILLTRNEEAIKDNKILDIASHDGRFSYACLKLGAKHVTGVEGREHLVKNSIDNFIKLDIETKQFTFVNSDIYDYMPKINPGEFDTILCFGFFYHTIRQIELLREIKRISPKYLIMDTTLGEMVYPAGGMKGYHKKLSLLLNFIKEKLKNIQKTPSLIFSEEYHGNESATINPMDLVARPTRAFIELFFKINRYNYVQLDWKNNGIKDWTMIKDYKVGKRVSYLVKFPDK